MAKDWTNTYAVTAGQKRTVKLQTPLACCKTEQSGFGDSDSEHVTDKTCAETPKDQNSNWKTVMLHFANLHILLIIQ